MVTLRLVKVQFLLFTYSGNIETFLRTLKRLFENCYATCTASKNVTLVESGTFSYFLVMVHRLANFLNLK